MLCAKCETSKKILYLQLWCQANSQCQNTIGSFVCQCNDGFELGSDNSGRGLGPGFGGPGMMFGTGGPGTGNSKMFSFEEQKGRLVRTERTGLS